MNSSTGTQEAALSSQFDAVPTEPQPNGFADKLTAYAAAGAVAGMLLVEVAALAWGSKPEPIEDEIRRSDEALNRRPGKTPTDDDTRRTAEALGITPEEVERQAPKWW